MAGIEECIQAGGSPVVYPLVLLNNTEYTTERFRKEHRIASRRLPSDLSNPEMIADVVVSHSRMDSDEWLWGIGLRLALSVYYKALLRATMWYLHLNTGVRFVDMLAVLHSKLFDSEDAVVRAVVDDYVAGILGCRGNGSAPRSGQRPSPKSPCPGEAPTAMAASPSDCVVFLSLLTWHPQLQPNWCIGCRRQGQSNDAGANRSFSTIDHPLFRVDVV